MVCGQQLSRGGRGDREWVLGVAARRVPPRMRERRERVSAAARRGGPAPAHTALPPPCHPLPLSKPSGQRQACTWGAGAGHPWVLARGFRLTGGRVTAARCGAGPAFRPPPACASVLPSPPHLNAPRADTDCAAGAMLIQNFAVHSDNLTVSDDKFTASYQYASTSLQPPAGPEGQWVVEPTTTVYEFETDRRVPKLG